ncbi:MAG: SRPBCC family protein [Methylotenera sp.]|nr:SRPBCC family protein [Methylotenera sp.]MDP2281433.1 SRPBCC family protein [Methylotenera sp.]MDP3060004.1 SRPBCC family protein [Methylotenera sp.]
MKWSPIFFPVALLLSLSVSAANAPSQQKVIREVVIKAEPAKVWAVVKDFGAIHKWHPAVESTKTETKADQDGVRLPHRLLTLKGGGTILEKQTINSDEEMKLEYKVVEGVLPVSGYRAVMTVKAGPMADESTVTWTGRFYNKANDVNPKAGEDNATAVKAVEGLYDAGLPNLKKVIEVQ